MTLVESITHEIEARILSGRINLGDKVNEYQIANDLQVSRASVREAVRRLEQWGLVEIVPNRGAIVCQLGLREVLDLYDLRAGLAHAAGRLLPARASTLEIKRLESIWRDMDVQARQGDAAAYFRLNDSFHFSLFEYTGNLALAKLAILEDKRQMVYLRREIINARLLQESNRQHREILDAIIAGDCELCAKLFETHVLIGKQRLIDNQGAVAL